MIFFEERVIRGHQRCHGNTLFTDMAAFGINLGIGKAGSICLSGVFLLLVANYQFVGKQSLTFLYKLRLSRILLSVSVKDVLLL